MVSHLTLILLVLLASSFTVLVCSQEVAEWPHYLTLQITFDSHPEEVSWKFENQRTQTVLDGVAFNTYTENQSNTIINIPLKILTTQDYEGDPLVNDQLRDYRFVIYDQGGNGLCCANGNGRYEIYSKDNELIVQGFNYGAIDEHFFSINPRDYLDGEGTPTTDNLPDFSIPVSGPTMNNNLPPTPPPVVVNTPSTPDTTSSQTQNDDTPTSPTTVSPPTIPTTQEAMDETSWFCGENWNWIENNCDKAVPCPRGDAVDCPANQKCFASTPCTLVPTSVPSSIPSSMPTETPTPLPTKSPWSESSFLEFLYGQSDGSGTTGAGSNTDEGLASDVIEALQDYSSLQFHFFCGFSWQHADETCNVFCPSGDKQDCPEGEECYAHTKCDGRNRPNDSSVPEPDDGVGKKVCMLCENQKLQDLPISFNSQTTTCGSLDEMLKGEEILAGSATCSSVKDMYKNTCCVDTCELCMTPEDEHWDLKSDHLVKQGGYEATCGDITSILSTSTKGDKICTDAQTQLSAECCYRRCNLCEDQSETEWSATLQFQGIMTTCLGLDYMLRAEQISDGSDQCSELQGQYNDRCCSPSSSSSGSGSASQASSSNACQLCMVDNNLYEINEDQAVTIEKVSPSVRSNVRQSGTITTCKAMNDSLEANFNKSDDECTQGKQAYFGQCCNLSNLIPSSEGNASGSSSVEGGGGDGESNSSSTGGVPAPSPSNTNNGTEPASTGYWSEGPPSGGDFTWDPPSRGCQAHKISSVVFLGLSALLLLFV